MAAYWAKIPVVRAAMLAHPEADWVWWVDADAFFTDMDFSLSLPRYAVYNLVVAALPKLIQFKCANQHLLRLKCLTHTSNGVI